MDACKVTARSGLLREAGRAPRSRAAIWLGVMLAAAAMLGGCASTVSTDLTVFHEWPQQAPRTYRIAADAEQLGSLEFGSYRGLIRDEMARQGFVESSTPRFELRFDTGIVPRTLRYIDYGYPYGYPYGIYPSFMFGSWGRHGGISLAMPLGGWGGVYGVEREQLWHQYLLTIEMRDLAAGRSVYEARASMRGGSPSIAGAMPYLVKSVFADFPGLSGVQRRVEINADSLKPMAQQPVPVAVPTQPSQPAAVAPAVQSGTQSGSQPAVVTPVR